MIESVQLSTGEICNFTVQKILEFKMTSPILTMLFDVNFDHTQSDDEFDGFGTLISGMILYNMGVATLLSSTTLKDEDKRIARLRSCRTVLKLSLELTQMQEFSTTFSCIFYDVLSLAIASLASTVISYVEHDLGDSVVNKSLQICHDMKTKLHDFVRQVSDEWGISLENLIEFSNVLL